MVVGRSFHSSGSGLEAIAKVREWWGVPPGGLGVVGRPSQNLGVVGRPSRWSGSAWAVLPRFQECSGGTPRGPGVVRSSFHIPGSSRETLPEVRGWSGSLSTVSGVIRRPS